MLVVCTSAALSFAGPLELRTGESHSRDIKVFDGAWHGQYDVDHGRALG